MNTIDILGDEETFRNIVELKITEFEDNEIETIRKYAFKNSKLTSVSFPKVTSIGEYAFQSCKNLTSIDFPEVTSLGTCTFSGCSALKSISLPKVTRSFGLATFSDCSALKSVSLPKVTSLGNSTFSGCSELTTLYIGTESDTICGLLLPSRFVFDGCSKLDSIYVPASLVNKYKSDKNWSDIADKIKAYTGV